ncbi:hypothetical protein AX774_g2169 [Zancudomyces culisetae]|uniref:Uncharacterized protein n=1 Tax=Zancudomyces culisetae TaxID=1213189 RepID=A0A1R1PTN5_ZANCU|nr:hypothetical protein AX774_g2169 [Zancudomyces culisetae]|eukprot:OMH84311.1 hypothetical protein AX774_g2169 [Zancudomyces culisetae]
MEHAGSRYRTSTSATASIAATRKGESKEDEDIRRAIELSLQESNQAKNKQETPVVTDDDLALKMALQESERYVQSQGTVNMPYNTASTSQFNNSNMYGFDGLSNAQFGYGSEFGSTVYPTNDPLSLQSQTPAFDVNSAPFDFGNTANPNSQFMFGTAADNAAMSKRAAKAELEAQNPFAAQLNAASTDPFGSSDPFGASAKFGNVFDTGKETKPLPFGVDLSGPSAMLAEVARNSNRIDPFANIATKNGSSTTAAGIAPSNPFAASQPVSQNFDTDFFPSGYNNSNNNTVDFQSSTLGYGKFNDFTNPGSNLDSNPGSNYGSAKMPHSNTFGSSQNPFI